VNCNCYPGRRCGMGMYKNRRMRRIFGPKKGEINEVGEV
jgi:hypothetical protein